MSLMSFFKKMEVTVEIIMYPFFFFANNYFCLANSIMLLTKTECGLNKHLNNLRLSYINTLVF